MSIPYKVLGWKEISNEAGEIGQVEFELEREAYFARTGERRKVAGRLRLSAVSPEIIRVSMVEAGGSGPAEDGTGFLDPGSLMVVDREARGRIHLADHGDSLRLTTDALTVDVSRKSGSLTWRDSAGNLLLREPAGGGRTLEAVPVEREVFDEDARTEVVATADGGYNRLLGSGRRQVVRQAFQARTELAFAPDEAVYGLGQHEEGILNYRGRSQDLYQQNMKVSMPVLVSTKGYGLLFDTNSLSAFRDDGLGTYFWSEYVDQLDFYFVYGPELGEVVRGLRRLTGTPTMLPRWAYGYHQSKERYRTAEELLEVAREYRKRELPLDCIIQDWMTWPGEEWGWKIFDKTRFPDPKGLVDELHEMNVRMMISVWPAMRGEQNENLKEMKARGHILPDGATYDAFNPEARAQYWEHAEKGLFSSGLDAWWCDCTEPFQGDWAGHLKMEPAARIRTQVDKFRQNLDPGLINAYSLMHSQGIYEGQRGTGSPKRVVNLTRSGYPGQHRYGTITWSGDIEATWKKLRQQIADGLNFTVTGNPRWTLDIGAFFAAPGEEWFRAGEYPDGCDDPGYRELYTRWFQYGVFLPMFRSHGTDTPREVWRFGEPGTIYYDTLKEFLELRYRLLPYIYSCAAAETLDDETLYRMLAFEFRADPRSHNVADQFLFGPAMMICPVTEAMEYGPGGAPIAGHSMTRPVYLPAGCRWHDFWTGRIWEGGQQIEAPAPIQQIPIYIRGGSIVPMGPVAQHAEEALDAPWDLRVHSGADGVFVMYEDAGDGWDYEEGAYARTTMRWDDRARMLTIGRREGTFAGLVGERTVRVWLDGVKVGEIVYAGDEVSVQV
jgi:alpha-D-xyloside xylohydrolase